MNVHLLKNITSYLTVVPKFGREMCVPKVCRPMKYSCGRKKKNLADPYIRATKQTADNVRLYESKIILEYILPI